MVKYSEEFKLRMVREYQDGPLGLPLLAKKYGLPSSTPLQGWVKAYQAYGEEGLRRRDKKTFYPVQFKLDVLHFMKRTGASLQETATTFGLNNPALIASWNTVFQRQGVGGLEKKPKGRPPMSKKNVKPSPKKEQELSRGAQLERENELLRLENAYLKKLKAFRENPDAYLEKHKQRWHSNSTKKDSD